MRNKEQRELLAKLSAYTNLQPKDCQPLRLGENTISKPVPPAQRTVFPIDTDWASPSTRTVLEAFQESYKAQVEESGLNKTLLPLLRASGAVEVDSSMADLFDGSLLGSTNAVDGTGERLVQCNTCHRPVLITRILGHVKRCSGKIDEDDETDTEMQLICPSYEHENPCTPPKTPPPEENTPNSSSPKKGNLDNVKSFVKEEDDWRTRITPVIPRYVPRGASSKKRRYALPPPSEAPAQRKKNINVERKALALAASAGIASSNPQTTADAPSSSRDALRTTAQKWGPNAPWSSLMQVALPLVVPRNPRKRTPSAQEAQAASAGNGIVYVNGSSSGGNPAKSGGKPGETSDKPSTAAPQGPTLLGSLLWLRGQGMKELSNTPLQSMDIPQMPISRSGPIFHGHTYFAALGTYETDPRHHNSIKLPTTSVPQTAPANATQNRANHAGRAGNTESRAKQPAPQPTMSATNSGSSQAPPTKKQRTSKQQRSQATAANGQHFAPGVQARTGQAPSRKMANVRLPGGVSSGRVPVGAQEVLQRMQQRNVPQPPKAVHSINQAVASAANAAAKYAAPQALPQRKMFRQGDVSGVPVNRLPPGTVPISAASVAGTALPPASKASAGRAGKGRVHAGVGSASPSMRSTGSVAVKSQSPGQHSSRSTDRTPMRTPAGVSQYDSALLATAAAAQVAAKGNRAAAMRPSTGNPELDFQQVVAQIAAQNRTGRDDTFDPTRGLVPNIAAAHQPDNAAARLQQAQAMRGMSPHARLQQQVAVQSAAQRNAAAMKNRQHRIRKDERELKRTPSIGQQLQQAEALQAKSVAEKVNALPSTVPFAKPGDPAGMNPPVSHGFYSAALAVAGQTAAATRGAALKGQPNMNPLLRMNHANRLVPGQADANASLLQNMHEVHQLRNMPVAADMRGAAQSNNILGMLQVNSLSAGFPNAGMNAGAGPGAGLGANVALPGQNTNLLSSDAILQQLFAGRHPQVNPNAPLHAQQMARASQMGHTQLPRAGGIPHPVVPTEQNNTELEELDRALGIDPATEIDFGENDLIG